MKQRTKLSQEKQQAAAHLVRQDKMQEFESVEELLRHDAEQTNVPPEIATRLSRSARETPSSPPASRSWWKNLFG